MSTDFLVTSSSSEIDLQEKNGSSLSEDGSSIQSSSKTPSTSDIEQKDDLSSSSKSPFDILDYDLPGHVNNLSPIQTLKMYQLWMSVFDWVDKYGTCCGSFSKRYDTEEDTSAGEKDPKYFVIYRLKDEFMGHVELESMSSLVLLEGNQEIQETLSITLSMTEQLSIGSNESSSAFSNDGSRSSLFSTSTYSLTSKSSSSNPSNISSISTASSKFIPGRPGPVTTFAEEIWRGFMTGQDDTDTTILRFLRARKWDFNAAKSMLLDTFAWRAKNGVLNIVYEGEAALKRSLLESGKSYFFGLDKTGRLIIYGISKLHEKSAQTFEENVRITIFAIEIGRRLLAPGRETITMIFDMTDSGYANFDLAAVQFLVTCFQNHYPESLGKCVLVNAPWIFWAFWSMIKPCLDPVVAAKIIFVTKEEIKDHVDEEFLPVEFGGKNPFKYSFSIGLPDGPSSSISNLQGATPVENCQENLSQLRQEFLRLKNLFVSCTKEICSTLETSLMNEPSLSGSSTSLSTNRSKSPSLSVNTERDTLLRDCLTKLQDKIQERNKIKKDLSKVAFELDRIILPKTYYDRLSVIDPTTGEVNWSKAKLSDIGSVEPSLPSPAS